MITIDYANLFLICLAFTGIGLVIADAYLIDRKDTK